LIKTFGLTFLQKFFRISIIHCSLNALFILLSKCLSSVTNIHINQPLLLSEVEIRRKANVLVKLNTNRLIKTEYQRIGYYEIVMFAFLLLEFLFLACDKVGDSNTRTAYLLTYEFGFHSQSLIGSIIYLFTDKITSRLIYIIAIVSFLVLAFQISILLGSLIRTSQQSVKSSVIIFTMLFLASPLSVTYLLGMHTERLDVYWIFITLLALVFLKRPILRWLIPILCAIAVSIHQGYMSTYMPALAILLLYEVYRNKYSIKSIAVFILSCITMISLFVFFQFAHPSYPFENAADFAKYLSAKSDFSASAPMLYIGFLAPFKDWFYGYVLPFTKSYALPLGIVFLTFSSPLIVVFLYVWKQSLKNADKKFLKFIFFLCVAAPLVFLPAAVLANDWDRYWAAAVNNQFILVFYFIYSKEEVVIKGVKKVGEFFEQHILLLIMILIFTNSFTFSQLATDIFSFIKDRETTANLINSFFNKRVNGY